MSSMAFASFTHTLYQIPTLDRLLIQSKVASAAIGRRKMWACKSPQSRLSRLNTDYVRSTIGFGIKILLRLNTSVYNAKLQIGQSCLSLIRYRLGVKIQPVSSFLRKDWHKNCHHHEQGKYFFQGE
jgi:hypothetical protein